jgi:hypothetical protein
MKIGQMCWLAMQETAKKTMKIVAKSEKSGGGGGAYLKQTAE